MTAFQAAAILLTVNAVISVLGVRAFGTRSSEAAIRRPAWLPPLWVRAAVTLTIAAGLWFSEPWAWWMAIAISAAMILWTAVASLLLALGGFFRGQAMSRGVYIGSLAATWIGVLAALLTVT